MAPEINDPTCSVCHKSEEEANHKIQQCGGCKERLYCGATCQRADWPSHKFSCESAPKWYDKHRLCQDNRRHEGKLELITWPCPEEGTGWGNILAEESEDLKRKFEIEYGGDEEKLYAEWPQGFRWTCCGTDGETDWGCDHHGTGSTPCTCDFCRGGKPLPDSIYKKTTASRMGLTLPRGPDPRSSFGF